MTGIAPSNISKHEAVIYLTLIALGIVFGANFFRTTVVLQPINQTVFQQNIIQVRMITGDNLIILNGTNVIKYEDGNLTLYWSGPTGIMSYDHFDVSFYVSGIRTWSYSQIWAYTSYYWTEPPPSNWNRYADVKIVFDSPKGSYESVDITDTHIIFQRVK